MSSAAPRTWLHPTTCCAARCQLPPKKAGPTWTKKIHVLIVPQVCTKPCLRLRRKHKGPSGPTRPFRAWKGHFGLGRALSGPKGPSGLEGGAGAPNSGGHSSSRTASASDATGACVGSTASPARRKASHLLRCAKSGQKSGGQNFVPKLANLSPPGPKTLGSLAHRGQI